MTRAHHTTHLALQYWTVWKTTYPVDSAYMYVYLCVCVRVHAWEPWYWIIWIAKCLPDSVYVYMYICMCTCKCMCIYVCVYVYVCVCVCVCICVCIYSRVCVCVYICMYMYICVNIAVLKFLNIGWLRLVGSLKSHVSFTKEPYKREAYSTKETNIFEKSTNRSHPTATYPIDFSRLLVSFVEYRSLL